MLLPPLVIAVLAVASAPALSLSETARTTLAPGVSLATLRTASPAADVWVAEVDLCADGLRIDATRSPGALETPAAWAADHDPVLVVNGDFFRTGPVRVYGDAVGGGVPWPAIQTGRDPAYASEWYAGDDGWIAFLPDAVQFTHTGWTKDNAAALGATAGFAPTTRAPGRPDDVMALVSGFPALVIEGRSMACADPTAASCFPDRSDMRARHPRTAMGLSADLHTLLLVVVDGRSSRSSGMYGSELAELMHQLGAWQAFNLDGGGSSSMWTAAGGTVNRPADGSARAVANHLGVFSGPPTGASTRPWHCDARPPCAELGPGGGTLDEAGPCFHAFGPPVWLRELSGSGEGGSLVWTNQFASSQPMNQAWWRLHFAEAGRYTVEWHGTDAHAVATDVPHRIRAAGVVHTVAVDQSVGAGWHSLGTFDFAAGGDQGIAIEDHASGSVAADQHIVFDALRLTRVGPWCGDGACDSGEDCAACPGDCPPVDEVVGNGEDDDCDGEIDEDDREGDDTGTADGPGPDTAGPDRADTGPPARPAAEASGPGAPGQLTDPDKTGCAVGGPVSTGRGAAPLLGLLLGLLLGRRRPCWRGSSAVDRGRPTG